MAGGWGAAAGAALQVVGDMASNLYSAAQARKAAKKARAFTREMMSSRHQWEVTDLRKAGLNPILSAGGTPSMGGSAMANVPTMNADIGKAVETGMKVWTAKEKKEQAKHEAILPGIKGAVAEEQGLVFRAQKDLVHAETRATSARAAAQEYTNVGLAIDADIDESWYGTAMKKAKRFTDQIPPVGVGALIGRGAKRRPGRVK